MIPHQRSDKIYNWFSWYAKGMIRKNFRNVGLTQTSRKPEFLPDTPIIALANHSSWWDAMLLLYLSRYYFDKESYGLFDEEQLKRYGIFRRIGCFSVNRDEKMTGGEGKRFLRYTTELLAGHSRMLWIFPQGDLFSNNHVPLQFKKGFAQIAARFPKVHLVKTILSYDFWLDQKPEIVIDILPVETLETKKGSEFAQQLSERVSNEMTGQLLKVTDIVKHRRSELLRPLLRREHGTSGAYDLWRGMRAKIEGKPFVKSHAQN